MFTFKKQSLVKTLIANAARAGSAPFNPPGVNPNLHGILKPLPGSDSLAHDTLAERSASSNTKDE